MSQTRVAVPPAGVEDRSATRVYVGVIVHLRGMTGHSSFAGRQRDRLARFADRRHRALLADFVFLQAQRRDDAGLVVHAGE